MRKKTLPKKPVTTVTVTMPLDQFRFLYNLIRSGFSYDFYEAIIEGEMGEPEQDTYTPLICHKLAQKVWATLKDHNDALRRFGRVP